MIDYHLHSLFSKDGREKMYDMCFAAKKAGLEYIAITDHLDYDDLLPQNWEIKDITGPEGYLTTVKRMRGQFPMLDITLGVEAGYTPSGQKTVIEKISLIKPDFVIGSLHFIDGIDVYDRFFFEGKTKQEAYDHYFEKLLESIRPLSEYSHIIGHLTYISKGKHVPYENPKAEYGDHKELIDAILREIISLGMGIEINTSGLLRDVGQMLPDFTIVKRYKELGGEILTVGSDAHLRQHVGYAINDAYAVAKEAGFDYLTIFPGGKQTKIKI